MKNRRRKQGELWIIELAYDLDDAESETDGRVSERHDRRDDG